MEITIKKIYKSNKTGQYGDYVLVNLITAKGNYTMFDSSGESNSWQDGQTIDISNYVQTPNSYVGKDGQEKHSIKLSKPKGVAPKQDDTVKQALSVFKKEIQELKDRVAVLEGNKVFTSDEETPREDLLPF